MATANVDLARPFTAEDDPIFLDVPFSETATEKFHRLADEEHAAPSTFLGRLFERTAQNGAALAAVQRLGDERAGKTRPVDLYWGVALSSRLVQRLNELAARTGRNPITVLRAVLESELGKD